MNMLYIKKRVIVFVITMLLEGNVAELSLIIPHQITAKSEAEKTNDRKNITEYIHLFISNNCMNLSMFTNLKLALPGSNLFSKLTTLGLDLTPHTVPAVHH